MASRFSPRIFWLLLADAAILYGGIILAMYLRLGFSGTENELDTKNGWVKILLASSVCLLIMYFYDLYDYIVMTNRRELMLRLVQALGIAWALLALLFYFVPPLLIGRGVSVISVPLVLGLLLTWRMFIHSLTGHPEIGEKILVVGTGQTALDTAEAVWERRDAGYRIAGFISENGAKPMDKLGQSIILGKGPDLESVIINEKIDRVVIAVRERRGAFPTEALLKMSLAGDVSIEECTSFFERITGKVHVDMLRPSWLIFAGRRRDSPVKTIFREVMHRSLALLGLVLSLPFAMLAAILIKLESRGPIFYKQERVGKSGKTFKVIKFRSMRTDAEKDGKPIWAATNDERVTRIGRVMRATRIDEIPQFWNILKGDMSFVGPRPERPHFVKQLGTEIPYYDHRHLVAPGLTGWAQIKYPYGASVADARQKLQYDLYYIKNQSLTLDLVIVFETVKTVLFGKGR
ncbi:MAG: TIGR03013 family PEP-CTERM/XrtA system glycosyltransferase [Acidobacteria bacterium]|nr:TIGR03013 family PEP-CTERM/XrtA system glycosyltransferase [Acidobacteriota bacterium]MBP7473786.1 TIGR03013 family PEP-CTERM/XrtA system glycosyltransferase [Pyrinomonadaceae bacterium]MBP9109497.1 TIGR03013 family PEP-CTERM/XrtA system glycosyltransferase [Pyrinomonadaceae bacterium]